jgi:hypothetical protein
LTLYFEVFLQIEHCYIELRAVFASNDFFASNSNFFLNFVQLPEFFTSGATTLDMQMALRLQEDTEKKDKTTMMTMMHHHRFVKHRFQVKNG